MCMKMRLLAPIVLLSLLGCKAGESPVVSDADALVVLDVTQAYPEKEILLSDIADVTYFRLGDEDEEYRFGGDPLCVTEHTIICVDPEYNEILFFSKDGQPKSKFEWDRWMRGDNPYLMIVAACYDDSKDEFFALINNRIEVMSASGAYKRTLSLPAGTEISEMFLSGEDVLLLFDNAVQMKRVAALFDRMEGLSADTKKLTEDSGELFLYLSREDGSLLGNATLPHDHDVDLSQELEIDGELTGAVISGRVDHIVNTPDGLLLRDVETDTLYRSDSSRVLKPVMVQTPSMAALEPVVYINSFLETAQYQFIELITVKLANGRYPATQLLRDKTDGAIYTQKVIFDDYKTKPVAITTRLVNRMQHADEGLLILSADEVRKAHANNRLTGPLQDFASSMDKNSVNAVYVLLKFK